MFIHKKYSISILLSILISAISYLCLNNIIPNLSDKVDEKDIGFLLYGSIIGNLRNFYIITISIIFICNILINNFFKMYIVIRNNNRVDILKKFIKSVLENNIIFFFVLNFTFIVIFVLDFDLSYLNINFIKYITLSFISEVLGETTICILISLLFIITNRSLISSGIIFSIITIIKSVIDALKYDIISFSDMIFFKSDFINYYNDIFFHISYIINFILIIIMSYLIMCSLFNRKDIICE